MSRKNKASKAALSLGKNSAELRSSDVMKSEQRALAGVKDETVSTSLAVPAQTGVSAPLLADSARRYRADDLLGFSRTVVPRIARLVGQWQGADGLVLGLYGRWGIGKTTIFNFLREYIEEARKADGPFQRVYVVDFHPWLYEDHVSLVASFFATLAAEVNPPQNDVWKETSNALKKMGKFLAAAAGGVSLFGLNVDAAKALEQAGKLSQDASEFTELLNDGEKTLREARNKVEAGLESIGAEGGRIVVLVDDLDRLALNELLSMLRLLRIAGDLPHVTLLVALDEQKVREILKAAGAGYGAEFLEKIIPSGIHVPYPERDGFRELSGAQIEAVLKEAHLSAPEWLSPPESVFRFSDSLDFLLEDIRTPRDLSRFVNALRLLFLSGETEADLHPEDAIWLEILHVFHPDVYETIRRDRAFFTKELDDLIFDARKSAAKEKRTQQVAQIASSGSGGDRSSPRIQEIIRKLFGDLQDPEQPSAAEEQVNFSERRIRHPRLFGDYFGFAREEGLFTRSQVVSFANELISAAETGKSNEIADKFVAIDALDPKVESPLLNDLSLALRGVESRVAKCIGAGVIAAIPQTKEETGSRLARIAALRIAGPEDYMRFDDPEREGFFAEFMRDVAGVLRIETAGLFLAHAGHDFGRQDLLDEARRVWLQRVEGKVANNSADADHDSLLLTVIRQLLLVSVKSPLPPLPNLGDAILAHLCRSPERLLHLVQSADDARKAWRENSQLAHLHRIRTLMGTDLIQRIATAFSDVEVDGLPREEFFNALGDDSSRPADPEGFSQPT